MSNHINDILVDYVRMWLESKKFKPKDIKKDKRGTYYVRLKNGREYLPFQELIAVIVNT